MSINRTLAAASAGLAVAAAILALGGGAAAAVGAARDIHDSDGLVYRYYASYGYRFQPLLSLAALNVAVTARRPAAARRLAAALLARGVRRGGALYWEYDFPYGGPARWTSGFVQAVAAKALARTAVLLRDDSLLRAAAASFRALRETLVMPLGSGLWVREYGFTHEAILNAQLESLLSLEAYARIVKTRESRRLADQFYVAARTLLPRFELRCWARYSLDGAAADVHYQEYHVDLVRRLASAHPRDLIWHRAYLRWSKCLPRYP